MICAAGRHVKDTAIRCSGGKPACVHCTLRPQDTSKRIPNERLVARIRMVLEAVPEVA